MKKTLIFIIAILTTVALVFTSTQVLAQDLDAGKLKWDSCMVAPGSVLATLKLTREFIESQNGCVRGFNMTWDEVRAVLNNNLEWKVIRITGTHGSRFAETKKIKENLVTAGYSVIIGPMVKDENVQIIQFTLK